MQQNDYTPGNQNAIACPQSETSVLQKQQRLIRQNISSIAYRVGIVLTSYLHYLYLFKYFATDCFFRCVKWNESVFFYLTGEHRMQFWKCGYLTWPCCCRIWPGSSGCGKSVYILIHTPSCYVYLVGTERYWWMHGISFLAWSLDTRVSRSGARGVYWGGEGELERGREGEAFKEMWRTNYLSAKNALCPSKNSFDRIFWQAPAAQLFQALSGMCWCYFQTRGSTLDLRSEQKGLLWILDEESIFPGANDSSFLARLYVHHCNDSEYKIIHHSSNVCR